MFDEEHSVDEEPVGRIAVCVLVVNIPNENRNAMKSGLSC